MKALNPTLPTGQRDLSRIGVIDYLLMTLGSCLAGFSGGMAISEPSISWFVVTWIAVGAAVGFVIRSLALRAKFIRVDGVLYGLAVVASFVLRSDLQTIMPQGGFPIEVLAAGWLCWILILGSFFTWQDSTLLFQAVPAIAMFGLVGCYDTFRNVVFLFFAFLLCLATLFARAHYREMLKQAAHSGYFTRGLAPGTPIPEVETTPGLATKMREGPWRWVAGPEWALGSALVVVLISVLGAPVIRQSTQGVSGVVRRPRVPQRRNTPPATTALNQNAVGESRIGQGPNRLTYEPVFEIGMDRLRYLRSNIYDVYQGRGWRFLAGGTRDMSGGEVFDINDLELREMNKTGEVEFSIRLRQGLRTVPRPGIIARWTGMIPSGRLQPDGSFLLDVAASGVELTGTAIVPEVEGRPANAKQGLEGPFGFMLDDRGTSDRVKQLAREFAGAEGTDYEKAERIRRGIAQTIKYNINAAAAPAGADPIEHVLFDQKEAYCDVFASSMVVMARTVGIPARYVTGWLPSPENRDPAGRFIVLEADAHAWAELWFDGVGWVVFDATEGAESVPGGERGAAPDSRPWYQREWVKTAVDGLTVVLLGVAVLFAVRAFHSAQRERTPRSDLDRAFVSYNRLLERAGGRRRDLSRTPDEFYRDVAPKLGPAAPAAEALKERFVNAMYAPGELTDADIKAIEADLRTFRQEVAAAQKASRS